MSNLEKPDAGLRKEPEERLSSAQNRSRSARSGRWSGKRDSGEQRAGHDKLAERRWLDSDRSADHAQGGTVYLTALAGGGTVYLLTFTESNQSYGTWSFTSGILNDETIAAQGGDVFIAGRDSGGRIYWYSVTGNSWFLAGGTGLTLTGLAGGK